MRTPQTRLPQDNNLRLRDRKNICPITEKLFTQSRGQRTGILQQFIVTSLNIIKAVCKNNINKKLSYMCFRPRKRSQIFHARLACSGSSSIHSSSTQIFVKGLAIIIVVCKC